MNHSFKSVGGIPTKVGEISGKITNEEDDIIVIIPGNPGVTTFYDAFAKKIHEDTSQTVVCVGHLGHNTDKDISMPNLKADKDLYGLESQAAHKAQFINENIPEKSSIHLVGHSIGAYMILNMLKTNSLKRKVNKVTLLFPAMENLKETGNGQFMIKFVKPFLSLILFFSWFFTILPEILQTALITGYVHFKGFKDKRMNINAIINLIHPDILERVFYLAYQEMEIVRERENNVLKQNMDKILILYGKEDNWAPNEYYYKLKADIPDINARITEYDHSFVLKESREVASEVVAHINKH